MHTVSSFGLRKSFSPWDRFTSRESWTSQPTFCREEAQVGRVDVEPSNGSLFGKAEVDIFASQESSQCPLWFSLSSPAPLGIDTFAHPWPDMRLYEFPPVKLIPAVLCRVKESGVCFLLVALFWPSQTWFSELIPLLYQPPSEIPIRQDLLSQLQGKIWHPQPDIWKLWVWPIQGHRFRLLVFLLSFRRISLVTEPPCGRGSCYHFKCLCCGHCRSERAGWERALSISEMCMDFAPGLVKVTLRLSPGYVPKVLSASFRSQVVTLHSFHPPLFASGKD